MPELSMKFSCDRSSRRQTRRFQFPQARTQCPGAGEVEVAEERQAHGLVFSPSRGARRPDPASGPPLAVPALPAAPSTHSVAAGCIVAR